MMGNTETSPRTGECLSPVAEVKSAVSDFMREFNGFRSDIDARLQQQESRLTMLDRKSLTAARPALASAAETEAPHQKAIGAYLRTGTPFMCDGAGLDKKYPEK